MFVIGITGGIACGKSFIAKGLRDRGFEVIDTDSLAKQIINEDFIVQKQIIKLLGNDTFIDGIYQNSYVARLVFSNKKLLKSLNSIVHPKVEERVVALLNTKYSSSDIVFIESALLFVSNLYLLCNCIIKVQASLCVRIKRLMKRDNTDIVTVIKKIISQMRFHREKMDLVVYNNGQKSISVLCEDIIKYIMAKKG